MPTENEEIARISGAHELGLAFVRSSILINGGAFVVLLGYMTASSKTSLVVVSLGGIKVAMSCFLVGIVSVLLALATSYLYTAPNLDSRLKRWFDAKIIPLNFVLCLVSLSAFTIGVATLICSSSAAT